MKEDESGWYGAPAGKHWLCPECNNKSPIADWRETEVPCEDCGEHNARICPKCGESFDHVWGADRILTGDNTPESTLNNQIKDIAQRTFEQYKRQETPAEQARRLEHEKVVAEFKKSRDLEVLKRLVYKYPHDAKVMLMSAGCL